MDQDRIDRLIERRGAAKRELAAVTAELQVLRVEVTDTAEGQRWRYVGDDKAAPVAAKISGLHLTGASRLVIANGQPSVIEGCHVASGGSLKLVRKKPRTLNAAA